MPIGKDWAKGLTKASDARIARNAAAHVGMRYTSHLPPEFDKRRRTAAGPVDTTWTPNLAYAVGLIATDGNLSPNHKTTNLVSKDIDLLEAFKRCIPRAGRIGPHGPRCWHVTVSSVDFYRWLQSVGLTPAKSLTLGALDVPDLVFMDLVRGLMDGDGSIENFIHHPAGNVKRYPDYRYERLQVSFHSASRTHLAWLRDRLRTLIAVDGAILMSVRKHTPNPIYELKYGKHATLALLPRMYADPDAPRLERKWLIWQAYLARPRINCLQKRRSGEIGLYAMDSRSIGPQGP